FDRLARAGQHSVGRFRRGRRFRHGGEREETYVSKRTRPPMAGGQAGTASLRGATRARAWARRATVASVSCHLSKPNRPRRKVRKSAPSSHCSGTPAAACRPAARNLLAFWMSGSLV